VPSIEWGKARADFELFYGSCWVNQKKTPVSNVNMVVKQE